MADDGGVLYLVVSGAPAPEGIPALVAACQAAGWRVVVFSTPTGTRFIDPAELETLDSDDEPGRETSLDFLRAQVRSAYQAYQATRYDAAGHILPGLIRAVEAAARIVGSGSPAACAVRARAYDTTAALLSRVGEPFLAWAASDRAMFAAEPSGDPLLVAATAWRLSYMITGRKHPQEAHRPQLPTPGRAASVPRMAGQGRVLIMRITRQSATMPSLEIRCRHGSASRSSRA